MLVRLHFLAALLALAGAFAPPALASDFDIDTSFGLTQGTAGWRRSYAGSGSTDERIVAAARAPDGGYVLAGWRPGGAAGVSIFLAKFRPDGSYDSAFGNSAATGNAGVGRVLKDAYLSSVTDMTIDSQGRIIVIGSTPGALGESDFGVVRFKPDGTDDTSFAGDGGTSIAFDADATHYRTIDIPEGVTSSADGSIFVAGTVQEFIAGVATTVVGVAKLTPAGIVDYSFYNSGVLPAGLREFCRTGCNNVTSVARILYDPAKDLLVMGGDYTAAPNDTDWFLITLNLSTQTVVASTHVIDFGGNSGYQLASMTSLAMQPDGKIVATGYAFTASFINTAVVLRRLSSVGSEDTSFGNISGRGLYVGNGSDGIYSDLVIDSHNRIILAGLAGSPVKGAVQRLTPQGVVDHSFNGGIVALYDAPISSPSSTAYNTTFKRMFLDRGQPVLVGEAPYSSIDTSDFDLVITRLKSDLIFANNFD